MTDESEYILVVEDDRALRDSLSEALRFEGYRVKSFSDGAAALDHLGGATKPCVILLDLMMPMMDGWTFRDEILKDRDLAPIPVVVMTAAGSARANAVPSAVVLHKPLRMDEVIAAIQQLCPLHVDG